MLLINSVPYYKVKRERLHLKEDKEGEATTYSGNVFHCDTVLGKSKKECKYESVCAKGW